MEITAQNSVSNVENNEIVIRKVVCDDMSQIYDILKGEIPDDELPPLRDLLRDGFESSPPWYSMLLASLGDQTVGVALYNRSYWARSTPPGRVLFLRTVCVRQSVRRRGVGTKLFRKVCQEARQQNAQLNWSHLPSNDEAKAFFAQFKPDITDDLDGTYIMRITLQDVNEVAAGLSQKYTNENISVQLARREDMADINLMLREISEIRGSLNNPQLNETDLITDGFTSSPPWFFALIAKRDSQVVGMIVGHRFYNWSPSLYMQSLYVRPSARRCGLANRLTIEFCEMAEGVEHVDFNVHPDNAEALALYRRLRAVRLTATDNHVVFRLDVDRIRAEFPPETCEDA